MKNPTHTTEEKQILDVAYNHLNRRFRVLAPASEARIIWREFDPCKAIQAVATVEWPATVAMRNVICTHTIMEDHIMGVIS